MLLPFARTCDLCDEHFYGSSSTPNLCHKCFAKTRKELMTKGTLLGMEMVPFNHLHRLLTLDVITNKTGTDARIHVAHRRDVLRAVQTPIKALCGNRLTHITEIQPLVDPESINTYRTHRDGETRWCPACEKRLRKLSGGIRMHNFAITMFGGMPILIGTGVGDRQSDTNQ